MKYFRTNIVPAWCLLVFGIGWMVDRPMMCLRPSFVRIMVYMPSDDAGVPFEPQRSYRQQPKTTQTTNATSIILTDCPSQTGDLSWFLARWWYLSTAAMSSKNGAAGLASARGGGPFSSASSSKDNTSHGNGHNHHNNNNNMSSSSSSSVQVVVRLRPLNDKEKKHGTLPVVSASTNDKTVTVIKGSGSRQVKTSYKFDHVFTAFSTQEEVFQATLQPVIRDVLMGFESTVFAYGQTGT